MQLSDNPATESTLSALGNEALALLRSGDISGLVERFGYALAFGREPETAAREDIAACLAEAGASGLLPGAWPSPVIRRLTPNDSNILAVIECIAPTSGGCGILLELVISVKNVCEHVTLEQFSVAV